MTPQPMGKILVVDDDPGVRNLLEDVLRLQGYAVTTTAGAADALAQFSFGNRFDLILTDYEMPGVSGLALARDARRLNPEAMIVIMTGNCPDLALHFDLHEVADHVLEKPFALEELRVLLGRTPGRRRHLEPGASTENAADPESPCANDARMPENGTSQTNILGDA